MKAYIHLNEIVTLANAHLKDGRNLLPHDLSILSDGAIVFDENQILWVGPTSDLPAEYHSTTTISLHGHILTPELVDSHTHLVFGGDRSQEYADRLNGTPYEEIAKRGGGILFTMKETSSSSLITMFLFSTAFYLRYHRSADSY